MTESGSESASEKGNKSNSSGSGSGSDRYVPNHFTLLNLVISFQY